MTKLNWKEFVENLEYEVARFPEKNDHDRVKHLYFQYYNKIVNAGENRHRLFSWTIQPLWGENLFTFEMRNIPPTLISYRFFIDFLKRLDRRSLKAQFHHGKNVRLDSTASIALYDARMRLRELLIAELFARNLYMRLGRRLHYRGTSEKYRRLTDEVLKIHRAGKFVSEYFDYHAVQEYLERRPSIAEIYQLLTLMTYIQEIECRFGEKMTYAGPLKTSLMVWRNS